MFILGVYWIKMDSFSQRVIIAQDLYNYLKIQPGIYCQEQVINKYYGRTFKISYEGMQFRIIINMASDDGTIGNINNPAIIINFSVQFALADPNYKEKILDHIKTCARI